MKLNKILFVVATLCFISTLSFARVKVHNKTNYWLHVEIPYIGIGSPLRFDLEPGETKRQSKDLANIKKNVFVKAYRQAPERRDSGTGPVAEINYGHRFGGSLVDVYVGTVYDAAGIESLNLIVKPR